MPHIELYTREQVKEHNTIEDCWMIVEDYVYNLSPFAGAHPGGKQWFRDFAGSDVTVLMRRPELHEHTKTAYYVLERYIIGQLVPEQRSGSGKTLDNYNEGQQFLTDEEQAECDRILDPHQGIIMQVHKLKHLYYKWSHTPQSMQCRFFTSPILEAFTHCPWYSIPVFYIPTLAYIFYAYFNNEANFHGHSLYGYPMGDWRAPAWRAVWMAACYCLGVLFWPQVEYFEHGLLAHAHPPANSPIMITIHFVFAGAHHKQPMGADRLVLPPPLVIVIASVIYYTLSWVLPAPVLVPCVAGVMSCWGAHELVHFASHQADIPLWYFRRMKHYHMKHHYVDFEGGFGITSPLWDLVFNTGFSDDDEKPHKN